MSKTLSEWKEEAYAGAFLQDHLDGWWVQWDWDKETLEVFAPWGEVFIYGDGFDDQYTVDEAVQSLKDDEEKLRADFNRK